MERRDLPLYKTVESPRARGNRAYACIYFTAILGLIYYRIMYFPPEGCLPWILVFAAELGFALFWICDQSLRWRPVDGCTFLERLSVRFETELPDVDIFICTCDPVKEPPIGVVSTVLSTLAFDYPTEKLSCYVSDDGGSALTFYALYEASRFAMSWVPFCRKYDIEQRCPQAYFSDCDVNENEDICFVMEWKNIKIMYEEMECCINDAMERSCVPENKRTQHKGFQRWSPEMSSVDHPSICEVLLEKGKDTDVEGRDLPNLVYVSREKRSGIPHNFKAGALNVLIRVSAEMSNAPFILTLDCDMYANNCKALREALCFFMDPETAHQFAYVQFPQRFHGIPRNDLYDNYLRKNYNIQFKGLNGIEGPMYVGTGCMHRREVLHGIERPPHISSNSKKDKFIPSSKTEDIKALANCTFEQNSLWGKKVGIFYDCAVEDVLTGFLIQCRGWKSALCTPKRDAFVGCAPSNLNDTLTQNKRWATGLLEIFMSKFCPLVYGISHIKIAQCMGYMVYCLWAPSSLHILCYGLVPPLCMLTGLSVFPEISSPWFMLFAFLSLSAYTYSGIEFILAGGSLKSWWNEQRMWMIKGVSSYLFALIQVVCKLIGIYKVGFELTSKAADCEAVKRYNAEIFEFGVASSLFVPPATLAVINLLTLLGGIARVIKGGHPVFQSLFVQLILSSLIVIISYPIYEGMLWRKDKGRMPTSITMTSVAAAAAACWMASSLSLSGEASKYLSSDL